MVPYWGQVLSLYWGLFVKILDERREPSVIEHFTFLCLPRQRQQAGHLPLGSFGLIGQLSLARQADGIGNSFDPETGSHYDNKADCSVQQGS